MYKKPTPFGSFKNKFQKCSISEHFYTFEVIKRIVISFALVFLGPGYLAPSVICGLYILIALYIAIKKPYMIGVWKRALFINISAVLLCFIYIGVSFS